MGKAKTAICSVSTPDCVLKIKDVSHVMCDGCANYIAEFQFVQQGPSPKGPCKTPCTYKYFKTVDTEICTSCGFTEGGKTHWRFAYGGI